MESIELTQAERAIFKRNARDMLKYSTIEYQRYKSTRNIIHLQQAGEKLFNATESYISYMQNRRYFGYGFLAHSVREKELYNLLRNARDLHIFFYNAETEIPENRAEELYVVVLQKLKNRIAKL